MTKRDMLLTILALVGLAGSALGAHAARELRASQALTESYAKQLRECQAASDHAKP